MDQWDLIVGFICDDPENLYNEIAEKIQCDEMGDLGIWWVSSELKPLLGLQKSGLTFFSISLTEFVKKYLPNSEILIIDKKDIEKVEFYIRQLHGSGCHDVEEFYKE